MLEDSHFDIFPRMLLEHADALYNKELHKGRFIGMYMDEVKKLDILDYEAIHLKYPQFVSQRSGRDGSRNNNWLDFMMSLNEEEFEEFKRGLNE